MPRPPEGRRMEQLSALPAAGLALLFCSVFEKCKQMHSGSQHQGIFIGDLRLPSPPQIYFFPVSLLIIFKLHRQGEGAGQGLGLQEANQKNLLGRGA